MNAGKKFPNEIIDHWPEVFGEITLNVVPLRYLESVTITFKNKKVWEIKIDNKQSQADWDAFESQLRQLLSTYEEEIDNVDFKLDTERIKKDMIKNTKRFLKKRKLQ